MNNKDRAIFYSVLRNDLASFTQRCFQAVSPGDIYQPNWHIDAIAFHLDLCLTGDINRLIITLPPRSLKSICALVSFVAWVLGHDPTRKIICASYSNELTSKHARDCRAVMLSDWYRKVFPKTRIAPEKNTESEFMTTQRGYRMGTSVGGTLTGRGGNLIIIDDPIKPTEAMSETSRESVKQWYDNTLYTRLDDKSHDVIILIMQRLHIDDLVGHVMGKEHWTHLNFPAIAEIEERIRIGDNEYYVRKRGEVLHATREPLDVLENIKSTMGTYHFSAQYQQNPIPPEGNLIKWKWFRIYKKLPQKGPDDQIIQSWDTASKADELNDYSVCTTWLRKRTEHYLIDVTRKRLEYPYLKKLVVELAQRHESDAILIEDTGSGTQLIQDFRDGGSVCPILPIFPKGDKVTRMSNQSAKIEGAQVLLPENAHWLPNFEKEILQFPHGRNDDQVDSMSQYLGWRPPATPSVKRL